MSKISFNNKPNPFFNSLKNKVDAFFADKKLSETGNHQLFIKNVIFILSLAALYIILVFFTPVWWLAAPLCAILGINLALIGFNIMHEGGHQSISDHKWLNVLSSYSLNLMGGDSHFWKLKHNISHHTYTNIAGEDHDINLKPFMRVDKSHPRYWFHRYQHWYWVVLYGMSYLAWILYEDFHKYFTHRMAPGAVKQTFQTKEHFIFWITKLGYFTVYIILPILFAGLVPTIIGYFITTFVCGFVISIVFQLAHLVEGTTFPEPNKDSNKIESEWAVHQVATTANFSTRNRVISWLLGGLNFQVEHHLFPRVSHIYYKQINAMVKDTCKEFKLTYIEYPSFFKAFKSHLSMLKRLGAAETI